MENHTYKEDENLQPKNNEEITENNSDNTLEENFSNITTEKDSEDVSIKLKEELQQEKDRYIRLFAEFENYKKRTLKEKSDYFQYANQEILLSLVGILDDFDRGIQQSEATGNDSSKEGLQLIYNKFFSTLKDKGLTLIEVKPGDDFNVDLHEAITQIPAPSEDMKGKIVDVIGTGYRLHDKVIRFAKVVTGA